MRDRLGFDWKDVRPLFEGSEGWIRFRKRLFSRIVPIVEDIGLWASACASATPCGTCVTPHILAHIRWRGDDEMGQVTIYMDDRTEKKARAAARAEGVSLSRWVTERIERRSAREWPVAVRALAGAWPDLPSAERLRKLL
jgi:hypothetical protein